MRVAVLGLGRMGSQIARRLEDAGHELSVWNRTAAATEPFTQRGSRRLELPSQSWRHADVVITMLADDDALRAVTLGADGLLSAAPAADAADAAPGPRGKPAADAAPGPRGEHPCLIDMSTVSAGASAEIARAAEALAIDYLRAPVSGNPSVVAAGNLAIIVSGPREVFERLSPTLRDIGPKLFHVGEGEQARAVKLALNLMIGGTTQLLAEALVLGERHGLERAKLLEVICASAIGSPYVGYKQETLLSGDFSSTFTARLLHKDLGLALEAGHAAAVPLPVTALVQQLVEACIAQGMGDLDLAVLVPALERAAGSQPGPGPSTLT